MAAPPVDRIIGPRPCDADGVLHSAELGFASDLEDFGDLIPAVSTMRASLSMKGRPVPVQFPADDGLAIPIMPTRSPA